MRTKSIGLIGGLIRGLIGDGDSLSFIKKSAKN